MRTQEESNNLLLEVAKQGNYYLITVALSEGANINAQDDEGNTPLHHAACSNACDVVKLLIEKRANLRIENNSGETPIDRALNEYIKEILTNAAEGNSRASSREQQSPAAGSGIGSRAEQSPAAGGSRAEQSPAAGSSNQGQSPAARKSSFLDRIFRKEPATSFSSRAKQTNRER